MQGQRRRSRRSTIVDLPVVAQHVVFGPTSGLVIVSDQRTQHRRQQATNLGVARLTKHTCPYHFHCRFYCFLQWWLRGQEVLGSSVLRKMYLLLHGCPGRSKKPQGTTSLLCSRWRDPRGLTRCSIQNCFQIPLERRLAICPALVFWALLFLETATALPPPRPKPYLRYWPRRRMQSICVGILVETGTRH